MTDVAGKRVAKDEELIELIGSIDELAAVVGVAELDKIGTRINTNLYWLMSYLSGYKKEINLSEDIKLIEADIKRMEKPVGRFLEPVKEMNPKINWARTVCRRVERLAVKYSKSNQSVDKDVIIFLNRLSDYLFILSLEIIR